MKNNDLLAKRLCSFLLAFSLLLPYIPSPAYAVENDESSIAVFTDSIGEGENIEKSPSTVDGEDISPEFNGNTDGEIYSNVDDAVQDDSANSPSNAAEDGLQPEINVGLEVNNELDDENQLVLSEEFGMPENDETDYTPTITKQPQSVAEEKSAGRTTSLTVEATGAGNGVLSYQWYEVGSSEDTALTDASATTKTYEASLKRLGTKSYYCIVTNTVNGKAYTVKSEVATVTAYMMYAQTLSITQGENTIFTRSNSWQGAEDEVTLDKDGAYTLTVLPMNLSLAPRWRMAVSYNGETVEAGAFQQNTTLDMSKFSKGTGNYFTVQIGYYNESAKEFTASELYKFNVTITETDYTPTITKQPQSVAEEKSAGRTTSLTVEAVGAGNGDLSYQWYEVGSSGDTALTDASATTQTYEASLKRLGTKSYYCIVTNTVNGQAYTVQSEVATVTVYQQYAQSLTITEGEETIFTKFGSWQGGEYDVTLDKAGAYTLTVLPMNKDLVRNWRMAVSYNGEAVEAGAFQQTIDLDMSKFSKGTGNYFTVQAGYYNANTKVFTASELYKFNVTVTETDYTPTITKQPQSVAEEKSAGRTTSLTVEATGAGNGVLSYQWYEVGSSEDTALTDASATTKTYEASLKRLGTKSYYCVVTNTVNGQAYTVKSEVVTVTVYMMYVQTLTITEGEKTVFTKFGSWQGGEYDVTLDKAGAYTLTVLPMNKDLVRNWRMAVSYNGEAVEAGAFQQTIDLDMSKFSKGTGNYFTVQAGYYNANTKVFTASELYKFNVTVTETDYTPAITKQPQSVAEEKSAGRTTSLTVEATGAGNGVLSYQWYEVGSSGDTALTEACATTKTYEASLKRLGTKSYYCIVTNTVNEKAYTVKSEVATVTVYQAYMATLAFCADNNVIASCNGSWQGGEFDVALCDLDGYDLRLQAIQFMATGSYSMTISYNGERGTVEPFKSSVAIDTSRFTSASGNYFTIQIGNYSVSTGTYISSEVYRFNVSIYPGVKSVTLTEDGKNIPVDVDFRDVLNSTKTIVKSSGEVKNGQLAVKIEPNKSSTQVYIGNSATPAIEQVITLADYKTEYSGNLPYALVPVKLIAQSGAERDYTLMVQITESHIKITQQPVNVVCYMGDAISVGVDAVSVDGGTLSYQWHKVTDNGDEPVTDANGANLAIQTNAIGETSYYCVITSTKGENSYTVKSDTVIVTVKDSNDFTPVILSQPASRITCNQGEKITLSVEVLKPPKGELSYQWYKIAKEDQLVANAKDYVPSTDVNSSFGYYCVITNTVDGKEYKAKTNNVSVRANLTKYIHAAEVIGQPGTYVFDENTGMVPGGYTAVAKGNSAPKPFNVRFQYVDYDVDSIVTLYHSTTNSYDGAELVKDAICKGKREGGVSGEYFKECEINPNTAYPTGEHYFYVVITLSPSDKNSTVKPVSTKSDILKIDFTDRETTMDGAGTEQNPYIIKTTEHLSEIQKMVADGDSFAGAYFQVANDVSLPTNWTPIGTRDTAFSGNIDGNHKKLTVPAGEKPLLGCINGASVKDLDIYGEQIEGAGLVDDFTGVGLSGSAIVLDNVTLKSGSKTLKSGLVAAGAGNGYASASAGFVMTIRNCTVESNVVVGYTGTESQIGSFAGRFQGTIENCTSSATVKGKNYVGGIIGTRDNAMAQCVVKNSTFHGIVESSGSYAGGIVGGGYDNQTAPNGACPTIVACTVDGIVRGNERVGGIFGGDGFVAQTWDNVVGSISANSFTGKVSGNKYVGAIIGYRQSLNRYDNIAGNTYSAGCGADKGIGYVKYLDTSYANPTKMDGTIVFNTANGTSDCPTVEGCAWRANHNRTDDPLGKDADKLCRVAGGSTEPICYELTASGTYKTEYTVGDELDLTGIVLTASWSNGTTTEVVLNDVTVEGYDQNKVGIQTITLKYGDAVAYITVTVKPESVKITVSVSILGDEKHGAVDEPHGLARGGLTAWAEDTSVEADTAETVWDVLQRVAKSKDIELDAFYSEQYGTYYIRGVNGLSEKDNGENSGWMYTVNGKHPEVGVSARFVNENDQIILHYTDDYTYEEDGENYGKEPPVTPKPDKTNATELLSGKSTTLKVLGKNGKVLGKNDITWTLKDPQDSIYATISATGTVKAKTVLTKHDVTFVGTLKGSYEGTVEQVVTILPKVTQVEIWKDGENVTGKTLSLNAEEGETLTLTAMVYPDELAQEVTWKSSNTKIAQIDAEGTVSFAGKTGTVTVTATSTDGSRISATVKLQVGVLTKSVTIAEPADHTLRSGKSLTLKATTDPVKPTVSGVTFKLVNASDSAYVSVSTSGKVSAKTVNEPHVVKIYAVSKDAAAVESNEITLTILPKNVQSLILKSGDKYVTNGKVVRNVNEELTLKAYTLDTTDGAVEETRDVTWTSSNTKVATIDETGKVTCVKTGTVKLTATADKKTKATVTLKVTNLVNGITIVTKNDKDSMVVASGKSLALKATVQPANASQKAVTWSMVSGSRYAKISSSGVVSANKGLTSPVTVTVKAVAKDGSGMEATQEITINPVALGVTISDVNHERTTGTLVWNMTEADNIQFSANVYPVKAVQAVTWKSSNAKIAAVDGTGKVTCYKAGTVTITATAKDGSGKKASFKLNIIKKLKSLTLEDQTVEGGKSLQLKAILDPVDPTNKKLTWTVSSNNVGAKISSSGKLTTKKVTKDTKVMVTVSSNDGTGLTATCFVTITPSVKK